MSPPVAEIISLRDGAPLLTDIPGMLRKLADQIEAGVEGEVTAAILLIPVDEDYPRVYGWGDVERGNDPIIQLELARMWLLTNIVERRS